ncbi:MAG: ROK family protein [Candidatus Saccharimonadales bacterium]
MSDSWQQSGGVKLLTEFDVPALVQAQLDAYTLEAIHSQPVMAFDSAAAVDTLQAHEGKVVIAGDFGGDKGSLLSFSIQSGSLQLTPAYQDKIQGDAGAGYLDALKHAMAQAEAQGLPFGLSWGGPLDGAKPVNFAKFATFMHDMRVAGCDDFRQLSPSLKAVLNDGPAGLISGAVEAYKRYQATNVLFIINGGGIGLGVLKGNTIYATEAGHVEAAQALNTYDQTDACGVFGATHVCVERLGANKAGIEAQWQAEKGSYMRARDIEDQYKAGDAFAAELYDHSALVLAHVLQGSAQALDIDLASPATVIVGHGGAFKFPSYGNRIGQILQKHLGSPVQLLMTKDYGDPASNACLDGAAIAALVAD